MRLFASRPEPTSILRATACTWRHEVVWHGGATTGDDTSPVVVGRLDKGIRRKYPSPFLPLVSLARSNPCLVLEENHPSTPLIRARTANSQSSAATRLLLVGLLGRRYYPCGSFAMSFYGKLIDGAENCTGERLTY